MENSSSNAKNDLLNRLAGNPADEPDLAALNKEHLVDPGDSRLRFIDRGAEGVHFRGKMAPAAAVDAPFATEAQKAVTKVVQKLQQIGDKTSEGARSFVRKKPSQAILIGLGVGTLIGYFLSRK